MISYPLFYVLTGIVLFFHSFLNFHLCDILSEKTRFHKFTIILACLANGLFAPVFFSIEYTSPALAYIICFVVLVTEFTILFAGSFSGKFGVALGSLLHLFVLRAIIVAGFSLVNGISMHEVHSNPEIFPWVNFASFAAQLITLTMFIKLIPLSTVKKIMNDTFFYKNLLVLTSLLVAYMTYNSYFFLNDGFSVNLAIQEIVIAIFMLAFFYIMILLLIKIFKLGIYEEKAKELEVKLDKDRNLTTTILNYADVIIEINCSKDKIDRLIIDSTDLPVDHLPTLAEFVRAQTEHYTHMDDLERIRNISTHSIILDFNKGIVDKEYEYRSKKIIPSGKGFGVKSAGDDYYWYRMRINTSLNNKTSEIISFMTIEEIHDEKEEELALRHRADSDHLTGAFNKNAFATKVDDYLKTTKLGVLYMLDLDNFKGINDNMGHSKGDSVLREVYAKVSKVFRSRDIIGRIGGDEFVVFLEGSEDESLLVEKAQRMCELINKTYTAENNVSIEISCSVGIAIASQTGDNFQTLFNAADLAMYSSKHRGKNTYTIYDENLVSGFEPKEREEYMRLRTVE